MSIIDSIKKRTSVRTYTSETINRDLLDKINHKINTLTPPLDGHAKIKLISSTIDSQPVKLGTYGVISGATHYLALIVEDKPLSEIAGAYMLEELILYCTELGLGTCWLGGTFKTKDFLQQIVLNCNEKLVIISPIGYKQDKKRLLESIMRVGAGSDKRKSFESLFFNNSFDTPLGEIDAAEYKTPLEMVRLAPSANNKQPWRIVKEGNKLHFYHIPNRFSSIDMGIALCHFELTCKELNLKGMFQTLNKDQVPIGNNEQYLISWIG